jgi:TetR/AcrR family transcriptional repressor of nem operon
VRRGTELFTEQGFHATSIEEVLARVGVPKGSFYYYFESKQAFGEAVIGNYADYFEKKFDRIFGDTSRSPLQRLRDFVADASSGMARFGFRRGCLVGNLGQELAGLNDAFRTRLEAVLLSWQARFAGVLEEARRQGEIPADTDVSAAAEFFWIGWEGAIMRAKLTRDDAPLTRFADVFFSSVLAQETHPQRPQ